MHDSLFTLVVTCYNQESLILETLESAKRSSYPNIELIIADDGSTDNTAALADDWLRANKGGFSSARLIAGEHAGISANHTRAFQSASGEFVKYIGGDDILLPGALQSMADFLAAESKAGICWSQIIPFHHAAGKGRVTSDPIPSKSLGNEFGSLPAAEQFGILSLWGLISGPGNFFRKEAIKSIGYFGTDIKSFEDYHIWLKAASEGLRIRFLPEPTVLWRRHTGSISFHAGSQFQADIARVMDNLVMADMKKFNPVHRAVIRNRYEIVTRFERKTGLSFHGRLERVIRRALDPFQWKYIPGILRIKLGLIVVRGLFRSRERN